MRRLHSEASSETTSQGYYAWGTIRPGPENELPTDYTYTGQKLHESSELLYYVARWYDPLVGRFLSPDSIVPQPGDPQSLNRFAYAGNNSLRYSDPTGHYSFEEGPDDKDVETGQPPVRPPAPPPPGEPPGQPPGQPPAEPPLDGYTKEDVEALFHVAVGEEWGWFELQKWNDYVLIIWVVVNKVLDGSCTSGLAACAAGGEFHGYQQGLTVKYDPNSLAGQAVGGVLSGRAPDPTEGATHFADDTHWGSNWGVIEALEKKGVFSYEVVEAVRHPQWDSRCHCVRDTVGHFAFNVWPVPELPSPLRGGGHAGFLE